jgi:putative DeoR family transcriptional regulator (stage III sporulation protein D)
MTERLPRISEDLAAQVKKVLEQNKAERHIRGGEATKKKYRKQRQVS